jgi:hypothetical protein
MAAQTVTLRQQYDDDGYALHRNVIDPARRLRGITLKRGNQSDAADGISFRALW